MLFRNTYTAIDRDMQRIEPGQHQMDAAREEALNHRVVLGSPMDAWNDVATDYPEE